MYWYNNDSALTFNINDGPYMPNRISLTLNDDGHTYDMNAICESDDSNGRIHIICANVDIDLAVSHSTDIDADSYIHIRREPSNGVLIDEMLGEFNVANDR